MVYDQFQMSRIGAIGSLERRRSTEKASPQFVGRYDPAAELRDAVEGVLASIDDAVHVATSLTSEQPDRVGSGEVNSAQRLMPSS